MENMESQAGPQLRSIGAQIRVNSTGCSNGGGDDDIDTVTMTADGADEAGRGEDQKKKVRRLYGGGDQAAASSVAGISSPVTVTNCTLHFLSPSAQ
ncbi:hypothetical protein GUJ93_ZPchr0010g7785 [Zizania palustris]|uniref:Uncharacterized protein n=1 Tax=Zizania palustris TaxID=103762 RepID=A0A8J5WD28_ZIZPA|nr:hypothetical protein GUJ93_ZPchr0010g7785 [Zizania palustris]